MDVSFLNEPHPGLEVRASPLRSGPRKTEVPRTSCAVYRSNNEKDIRKDILFRCRSEEEPLPRAAASCLRFASTLRFGRFKADIHWTSCAVYRSNSAELQSYCVIIILMIQLSYVDCLGLESDNRR